MSSKQVLVVDDEEDILELVRVNLSKEGYRVECATTGEASIERIRTTHPDLMVLDLILPGMDSLEVARFIKKNPQTSNIPIVMLTAKMIESDVVTGLEMGADDYITKPFSPRILAARVKAVLRRDMAVSPEGDPAVRINNLVVHPGRHEVLIDDKPVMLTFTEFGILNALVRRPGWVFTRTQLMDEARGGKHSVTDRSVDVQVVGLRRKLGPAGAYIETVRGGLGIVLMMQLINAPVLPAPAAMKR